MFSGMRQMPSCSRHCCPPQTWFEVRRELGSARRSPETQRRTAEGRSYSSDDLTVIACPTPESQPSILPGHHQPRHPSAAFYIAALSTSLPARPLVRHSRQFDQSRAGKSGNVSVHCFSIGARVEQSLALITQFELGRVGRPQRHPGKFHNCKSKVCDVEIWD
jgi:hypothetical protein